MSPTLINSERVCAHFGVCGGCSRQNLSYTDQLRQKEAFVQKCLQGLPVDQFNPILPSPDQFFYRNKMEFSFGDQNDVRILGLKEEFLDFNQVHLGLHPKGRFALVAPTPDCLLQSEESQKISQVISDWATENNIPVYVRKNNAGVLRHCLIREGKNSGERLVMIVTTSGCSGAQATLLAEKLKESGVAITTFMRAINDELSDVASGTPAELFWGPGYITERVHRLLVKVNPHSFMQTNTHASEKMIELLSSWAPESAGTLVDLYCGVGVIGLNLIERFERLVGIESNEQAVDDARANAIYNGYLKTEFLSGRVEDLTSILKSIPGIESGTVVVDPPRMGLSPKVVQALLDVLPPHVFYVSCNPETLARDLRGLEAKYRMETVQPMDFFPHTDHVETAVRLRRKFE